MTHVLTDELAQEARGLIQRLREILREQDPDASPAAALAVAAPAPPEAVPAAAEAPHAPARLTDADYADAAMTLGCEVAIIKAVCAVESNGHGFAPDGRAIILFEPHVFSRLTAHRYDATFGGVSYTKWGQKPYPTTQGERWDQLLFAAGLDHDAAFKSASYGLFQIMGFNFAACGFGSVDEFVAAMAGGEREHLMAFIRFAQANHLDGHLRDRAWLPFATGYNGTGQAAAYAAKLAHAAEAA